MKQASGTCGSSRAGQVQEAVRMLQSEAGRQLGKKAMVGVRLSQEDGQLWAM